METRDRVGPRSLPRESRNYFIFVASQPRSPAKARSNVGMVGARSTICRRFVAILMVCAIEQRLSPAEQSSSFLLDAQDNQDSAEFSLCRSIRIGHYDAL